MTEKFSKSETILIEDKWQKKWKDNDVFKPNIDSSKEKYVATVAYPYANSVLHIGHGRTFTMADIVARYHRVLGKNVLYPMGFHISGTPVLAVADNIARGDEKQIKQTREAIAEYVKDEKEQDELLERFKDPFEIAKFFSSKIEETFDSIGLSIDWSRQFSTGDEIYNKFIEWQYNKLYDIGILVQGKYPILYSVAEENAVGEDDIKDGDIDKVTIQEMTYILFKIDFEGGEDKYIMIATLRPDALFGSTNLWVHPRFKLVEVKFEGKIVIVTKAAFNKLKYQFDDVELLREFEPEELLGKEAFVPLVNRKIPILDAEFLDENHGTGIAYSSPAGSPHDFIALKEANERLNLNIEVIPTVETRDKKGNIINYKGSCPAEDKIIKFGVKSSMDAEKLELAKQELYKEEHYGGVLNENAGEFKGQLIKNAKDLVKKKLVELGLGGDLLETSRRAVTRGGDQVIVAKLDGQWFLNYRDDEVKNKAYELLDNLEYKPEKLRATQKGYLKWVEMRPCARKRGLGTKLPYDRNWIIEPLSDSTIYQMLYFIHNIIVREGIKPEQLIPELFDYIYLGIGDLNELSKVSNIGVEIIKEMKSQVEYWNNIDIRYTNMGHMSNHLSFLIYHYALIFPKKNWPKNITVGGYLIKDGAKISKSKGNGIPLMKMKQEYGVDLYRLYVGIAANYDIEMDFRDEDIKQLEKKFNKFKNYLYLASKRDVVNYNSFSNIDKWLISRFYSRAEEYFNFMDEFRIREAFVGILYEFLNDISYHQRRTNEGRTLDVLRFILEDYLVLMTPVIPHFTEEIYEIIKKNENDFISLKGFNKENIEKYIDRELEEVEGIISNLINNISRQKELKNIHSIKKIEIIQASDLRFNLFKDLKDLLENGATPKDIMKELNSKYPQENKFIKKFVPKTFGSGLDIFFEKKEERELFNSIIDFLKEEFGAEDIEVVSLNEPNSAIPSVPLVRIE